MTIIKVVSEAGISVLFKIESNFEAALTNIRTLLKKPQSTSTTIIAGLLTVSNLYSIKSMDDMEFDWIEINFRSKKIMKCQRKDSIPITYIVEDMVR